jgi:hypothetical protein
MTSDYNGDDAAQLSEDEAENAIYLVKRFMRINVIEMTPQQTVVERSLRAC